VHGNSNLIYVTGGMHAIKYSIGRMKLAAESTG
jgi:hypothetical protein